MREESNWTLKSTNLTSITLPDFDPHGMVLPTNQVPWDSYYRRNFRKEIGSPTDLSASIQDSEPPRDKGN